MALDCTLNNIEKATKPRRPLLRYHGGKWLLAPWIIEHFPKHRIYCEPFCGAASVLLRKEPAFAEVINDLDDEIVNLFRVLRDREATNELIHRLHLTPWARKEFLASYEETTEPIERARNLIVRAYMAFGTTGRRKNMSGFRGRSERKNSTGIDDWQNYPESLRNVVNRFRRVIIENRPAIEILRQQDDEECLFYCDPPYPHSTRSSIRWPSENDKCYAHEMSDDQHRELAEVLRSMKGMVVLSGYACDLYDKELYPDWDRFEKDTVADGAKERVEVLWMNPAAFRRWTADKAQPFLFDDDKAELP